MVETVFVPTFFMLLINNVLIKCLDYEYAVRIKKTNTNNKDQFLIETLGENSYLSQKRIHRDNFRFEQYIRESKEKKRTCEITIEYNF